MCFLFVIFDEIYKKSKKQNWNEEVKLFWMHLFVGDVFKVMTLNMS